MAPLCDVLPTERIAGAGGVLLRRQGIASFGVGVPLGEDVVVLPEDEFERLAARAHPVVSKANELRMVGLVEDVSDVPVRPAKRAFDVIGAILLLLLGAVPMLLAMVAVKLDSSGPAIFTQYRVGRGGRLFRLYKLRTMRTGTDASAQQQFICGVIRGNGPEAGGLFKLAADPRITRVGRLLRRCSIDELPQAWNVLRGDMSLVGPRPPLPFEVALYDERAWRRLRVPPGITGLWQVSGRSTIGFDRMIELDLAYVCSASFITDLRIVLRTPIALLSGRGAV